MGSVQSDVTTTAGVQPAVYVAVELSKKSWLIALRGPGTDRISLHRLAAGNAAGLLTLIVRFRKAALEAVGTEVAALTCQEAGYDGFWLHRVLTAAVSPASWSIRRASMSTGGRAARRRTASTPRPCCGR